MNIAIISHYYLNYEHKKRLEKLGTVSYLQKPKNDKEILNVLKNADVAVLSLSTVKITSKLLNACKNLQYISLSSIGYDKLDIELVDKHKILVSNNPGYCSQSVAEHTFGLLLSLLRKIPFFDSKMRKNPYQMLHPEDYVSFANMNLFGKKLGLVGYGEIGKKVAKIGNGFGMRILVHTRSKITDTNVKQVSFENLLKESDVVSLHLPLTKETVHLIDGPQLNLMKPSSVLISTTRGSHINNKALAEALENNIISGAGLDVLEYYDTSNPLLSLKNKVVITPHSAWLSNESYNSWAEGIINNLSAYINQSPINLINQKRF